MALLGGNIRNQISVYQNAGLKPGRLRERRRDVPRSEFIPTMDRQVKPTASWETGHEAGHGRQAEGSMGVGELVIVDDLASNPELLERNMGVLVRREEEDVPVLEPHRARK